MGDKLKETMGGKKPDIKAMVEEAVRASEEARTKVDQVERERESACTRIVKSSLLDPRDRPTSIQEAVRQHRLDGSGHVEHFCGAGLSLRMPDGTQDGRWTVQPTTHLMG